MRRRLVFSLPMAFTALACSTSEAPTETGTPILSVAHGAVVASVTGSGHRDISSEDDRAIRHFTISAVKHADGIVSGAYRLKLGPSDITLRGTVTCLNVVGNSAFVGGSVDVNPFPFDIYGVAIELIDNGTAPADPDNATDSDPDPSPTTRDQVSPIGLFVNPGEEQISDYCATAIPGPTSSVDFGNLTVQ